MKIVFSEKCLEYNFPGHPESSSRVKNVYDFLKQKNIFEFIEPLPASEEDVLKTHNPELIEKIKKGGFLDADTFNAEKMFDYALLSVGAAVKAQELAFENGSAFSLMRPPGHHAQKNQAGGFCYFNNITVAVLKALEKIQKIAIIDIDVHHGNGTEDIFFGDERVLFVSLHQSPFYPGTGLVSKKNCLNFPLPPMTGESLYFQTLEKAIKEIKKFSPQMLAVSAGFDTYREDPLADFNLEKDSYKTIAEMIFSLKKPCFSVLEGGYSKELPECVFSYLSGII